MWASSGGGGLPQLLGWREALCQARAEIYKWVPRAEVATPVSCPSPCPPGVNYVHQFCVGAAKGVLSPFVLQEIVMETLQRLNPIHAHNHLRAPAFHQLVQRCQQAYMQVIT